MEVVEWTKEQFETSAEPYKMLYDLRTDPFRQAQMITLYENTAKSLGIKNFKTLWNAFLKSVKPERRTASNATNFSGQPFELDCGDYTCEDYGVTAVSPMFGEVTVCSHPIMPVRRIVNIDTGERKTELAFKNGKHWQRLIVLRSTLASAQKIVALADQGIDVTSETARMLVTYLARMEALNVDKLQETQSAGRMGWVNDTQFLPYMDGLMFDGMEQYRSAYEAVRKSGTYEAWLELANEVRSGPNVVTRVMLAASFASVLIKPLKALPFLVHCWSDVSGLGKTVALMMAASVWACPKAGAYVKNLSSTSVGMEMTAGFLGSLPYCLDELCLKDRHQDGLEDMIYQFCEGSGKTRGARNGGVQRQQTWNCCAITTGETPIVNANARAGAVNRVLDLKNGETPMMQDPRRAVAIIEENYGHAGPAFLQAIMEPGALDAIRTLQNRYYNELISKTNATDKQVLTASLILAADKFAAIKLFDDMHNLTVQDLAPFLQTKEDVDVNLRAYEWLMDTVSSNPMRFSPREDDTWQGEAWGIVEESADGTEGEVYIVKAIFDKLMVNAGYNSRAFCNWAKKRGLLRTDGDKERYTIRKRIRGMPGLLRCVCIDMTYSETAPSKKDTLIPVTTEDLPW